MPRIARFLIISGLFAAAAIHALYGAHFFPDYPVRPADQYTSKTEKNGVVAGAEAVEDPRDQQTYFNARLTRKGFLPVFVVINNNSSSESFILEKQNVGFVGVSNRASDAAGTAFGTDVQQNILKKGLRSATLSPRGSIHGFLFVPVPKDGAREKIHLQIPITRAGTHETFILNLYL